MKKSLTVVALLGMYAPFAMAADSSRTQTLGLITLGIILAALAYAGNKWRLWFFGFQIGDATAAEFFSALKWSLIALVVSGVTLGLFQLLK